MSSAASRSKRFGCVHTRRCIHKLVHTQDGAPTRQSVATARVMLFKGPQARRYTHNAVHPQGTAHCGQLGAYCPRTWVLLFQEAHGVGGVSERAGSSAGRNTARRCGPDFRPKSSAAVSAGRHRHWLLHFRPSRSATEPHCRSIPMSSLPHHLHNVWKSPSSLGALGPHWGRGHKG